MDLLELEENLQIVFDKEENDLRKEGSTFYYQGSQAKDITYPNAEMLVEIFTGLGNDTVKCYFIDFLKKRISDSNEIMFGQRTGAFFYVGTCALCFYTLVELGYTNDAIESLKKRQSGWHGIHSLLQILGRNYFDSNQLKEISKIVNVMQNYSDIREALRSKIIETRFEVLKTQIKKVNVEINQDKKTVAEKINLLGLSRNYNELLSSIDNFILTDTSKVVNAGMISTLRTFMADLLKDVANRIADGEGTRIPKVEGRGEMGNIRSYLKSKLDFSNADDKFIDSFIDVLHTEGGHSFMSETEYFRLSRNIAIEIALFVLSKYEKKYKK